MTTPIVVSSEDIRTAITAANIIKGLLWSKTDLVDIRHRPARSEHPDVYLDVRTPRFYSTLRGVRIFMLQIGKCAYSGRVAEGLFEGQIRKNIAKPSLSELNAYAIECLQTWYPDMVLNYAYGKSRGAAAMECIAENNMNVFFYGVNKCLYQHESWPNDGIRLTTLDELGRYLKLSVDNRVGIVKIDAMTQSTYRLGDIVKMNGVAREHLMDTASLRDTIGRAYVDRTDKFNDFETLTEIVLEHINKYGIEIRKNRLVLHLRLSDHPNADTELKEVGGSFHKALHSQEWCQVIIMATIHIPNSVMKPEAEANFMRDQSTLVQCINMTTELNIPYEVQSSEDADYDFCLGCASTVIPSVGRFSEFMCDISQRIHQQRGISMSHI